MFSVRKRAVILLTTAVFFVLSAPSFADETKIHSQEKSDKAVERQEKITKDKNLSKKEKKLSKTRDFKVKYSLKNAAEVAVNIIDSKYFPIRTFVVAGELAKKSKLGSKKGQNEMSVWDGKDMYGNEAPPGEYYASVSVVYKDGKQETFGFKFVKE